MAIEKTIDILADEDLMAQYNLKKNFIDRNSKKMGGNGRPRRFIRANVEALLMSYYSVVAIEAPEEKSTSPKGRRKVIPFGPDEVGDVLGRGGRRRDAEKGAAA